MPDVSGVQILQGTQELGKDLVFYINGGFGEHILCACVVKNSKITGEVRKSAGARTIFMQAQQAFDSPHTDGFGREINVERVYVITPYDLPPLTSSSIKGALRDRSGQVLFIGGTSLFDLFKKYWPDFVSDEAVAIESHLRKVRQGFEDENPLIGLATQYGLGNISIKSSKVYVSQIFFRDILKYTLGSTLTDLPAKYSKIPDSLSPYHLTNILNDLKKLQRAWNYLEEWNEAINILNILTANEIRGVLAKVISTLDSHMSQHFKRVEAWEKAQNEKGSFSDTDNTKTKLNTEDKKDEKKGDFSIIKIHDASTLNTYLQSIRNQYMVAVTPLIEKTLLFDSISPRPINEMTDILSNEVFLSACNLDHCARIAPDDLFTTENRLRVTFPKDILDKWDGHLMIVGAPGYGKTSFCRWNALNDAEKFAAGNMSILPVYVALHQLSRKELSSFSELFLQTIGRTALLGYIDQEAITSNQTRIRLYLDGLDEVASPSRRRELMDLVRHNVEGNSRYQVVLTARDHIYGSSLNWLPRVSLGGFGSKEIYEFVDKWLGTNNEEAKEFYLQLQGLPALSELMKTPLLATLIILVFKQTGRLPENKTRLYEIFIELLSGGWDIVKGILRDSKFGQRVKLMVLRTLAARLHENRQSLFGDDEIRKAVKESLPTSILRDWEVLRDELIVDGVISRSGDSLYFSHLSLQEFLTAKDIILDPQTIRADYVVEHVLYGENWWREVLMFYIGLTGKPQKTIRWLLFEIHRHAGDSYEKVPEARVISLLRGVVESFPEFSIEDLANYAPTAFDLNRILSQLKKAHQETTG